MQVAPHTGAWIETSGKSPKAAYQVAPHTGAWIETIDQRLMYGLKLSHPTRVRGLKLTFTTAIGMFGSRTPHGCVD